MGRSPLRVLNFFTFGLVHRLEDRAIIRRSVRIDQLDRDDPIIFTHSVLGEFQFRRRFGWWEREIDWCGRQVNVNFKAESPAELAIISDGIATFFADASAWRDKIAKKLVTEIPELLESWNMGDHELAVALWRESRLGGIWFEPDGVFAAHFERDGGSGPCWVSAHGSLSNGVNFAMIEV